MRDPKRIISLCLKIAALWQEKCPDLRFMQLMGNFRAWLTETEPSCIYYYMEDDTLLSKFTEYMNSILE